MKKSLLFITLAALMIACGGNKAEAPTSTGAEDAATENAETAEKPSLSEQAQATDAKSIIGFAADELKFGDIVSDVKVGEVKGKAASVIVIPTAAVDANFNAFSKALFDKLKAAYGSVGNDTKEALTQPYETTGGISVFVYSYTVDGHDVYCSLSNTGGESGKDYELIFTKY